MKIMKTKLLIVSILTTFLFACSSNINKSDIPKTVLDTFSNKYSDTLDVHWSKEGDNYKAEFKEGEMNITAMINDKGEWGNTKTTEEQDDEDVETILHTLPVN